MRDWVGGPWQLIDDERSRDFASRVDYFLRDVNRGFSLIQQGLPPTAGGAGTDTGFFFLLPGRVTNQVGFGGTGAGGTLTLSSTASDIKGFVYLGTSSPRVAFDETNALLGIGTDSPAARLHVNSDALGTSTVGALGTTFARFSYGGTANLDIAPILNGAGVVDVAFNVNTGSVQFIDSSIGTAGMRVAFSSTNAFLQAGRIDSGGVVQNRNLQFGGVNATVGTQLISNFQRMSILTTLEGSIPANDALLTVNLASSDYASSTAANRPAVLIGARSSATTVGALVVESASTTNNTFEVRAASTGVSPTKALGSRGIAVGPGLGSLNTEKNLLGYFGDTETWRLAAIDSATLRWGFMSAGQLNHLEHLVTTALWADSLATNSNRIALGDTASSLRIVGITSGGGNTFDRVGITTRGMTIENTTLGGGAAAISVPGALLDIVNNATNGTNGTIPFRVITKRSGQTANLQEWHTSSGLTSRVTSTGAMVLDPSASATVLTLQPFNTTSVLTEWQSRSAVGTVMARMSQRNDSARFLMGTTTVDSTTGMLEIVPPNPTGGFDGIPVLRAKFTNTAAETGWGNGFIDLSPTLSDSTFGVDNSIGINLLMTVTNGISEYNGIECNVYFDNDDALIGATQTTGRAIHFEARTTGSGSPASAYGFLGGARHTATGTLSQANGGTYYVITNPGAGTLALADVVTIGNSTIQAPVTTMYMLRIGNPTISGGGSIGTLRGITIAAISGATTNHAIYSEGGQSVHVGNFFFGGTTSPTAKVHLAAGTTAASTAPLKLTTGTLMTSPEDGAMEYDGDYYYLTESATRAAIATDANVAVDADTGDVLTYEGELLLAA